MKKPGEYAAMFTGLKAEWKWLFSYILKYKKTVALYVVIGLFGTAMGLAGSVAGKYLIDSVVSHNRDTILLSAVLVIGLSLFQIFMGFLTSRIASVTGTKVSTEVRSSIYEHIVRSKWEDISKYHSGELINRLEGDVSSVSSSIISFIPSLFTRLTMFVGCLALVLYYDPTMAAMALLSAPVLFLLSRYSANIMRKYNKESREANGRVLSYSEESIQNLQTVKAFDLPNSYTKKFWGLLSDYRRLRLEHDFFTQRISLLLGVIGLLVSNLCYGWGVWRLWQGAISFGTMTMFLQITGRLSSSFSALVSMVPTAISIGTAAGRIKEITDLPLEPDSIGPEADRLAAEALTRGVSVRAENVTYTYRDATSPVLSNVSFSVSPGETAAFVGPSGEGKTTVLRMLLALIEPNGGSLSVSAGEENLPISPATRRLCAYVPQGSTVFSGTVAENLRIVRPEATDEELIAALKTADAWSFIEPLPQGLETLIGERGVNFSEGQVQRLSIARALLKDAPLLIMDEATSALDTETEARVLSNIMVSDKPRTCIITTHRPSMLRYCQKVYRISENTVTLLDEPSRIAAAPEEIFE